MNNFQTRLTIQTNYYDKMKIYLAIKKKILRYM